MLLHMVMGAEMERRRRSAPRPGEELVGVAPLLAIGLFALNNFWFKAALGNALTGKLSDFTACFFLPLFIAATLAFVGFRGDVGRRTAVGALITTIVFASVKLSPTASNGLDGLLTWLLSPLGVGSHNRVDPTDLLALPFCALAVVYARHRFPADRLAPKADHD